MSHQLFNPVEAFAATPKPEMMHSPGLEPLLLARALRVPRARLGHEAGPARASNLPRGSRGGVLGQKKHQLWGGRGVRD